MDEPYKHGNDAKKQLPAGDQMIFRSQSKALANLHDAAHSVAERKAIR
jgi:hypothetical protein